MKRLHSTSKQRLKPPYRCPICFRERAVQVKKETNQKFIIVDEKRKLLFEVVFNLSCQHGCFNMILTYNSRLREPVDAYCDVVDLLWKKHEESLSTPNRLESKSEESGKI